MANSIQRQVDWAYYLVSVEFLLRVIDSKHIYDANVAVAQLQTELHHRLGEGVTVKLVEGDATIQSVVRDYAPDTEMTEKLVDAAWDDAVHVIVLKFWLP